MIRKSFSLHRRSGSRKPELSELYQVGTVAYIKQVVKLPHDLLRVLVEGIERAELLGLEQEEPFSQSRDGTFLSRMERSIQSL